MLDSHGSALVELPFKHGSICLGTGYTAIPTGQSEGCLFLDVYAPSTTTRKLKPVYIFIQGGGFNHNANLSTNGSSLITASGHNIMAVTFNYRVGPYGFLASKEVKAQGNTNIGLKDQRKVFE